MKIISLALACCLIAASVAHAAPDKGKEQMRRVQQQLKKAEQEKSDLAQQKAEVEGQLKDAQDKLDKSQRESSGKLARVRKDLDAATTEKNDLATKLADTQKSLADANAHIRQLEGDKSGLEAQGVKQREQIARCEDSNVKLYRYGNDLLGSYQKKSCSDSLLQAEPVTGLKRAEIENLVEDYRDKLDAQRIATPTAKP